MSRVPRALALGCPPGCLQESPLKQEKLTAHSSQLTAMPKAELHVHLDGCLRLETIADLAAQQQVTLPGPCERLAKYCVAPSECRNLMEVLSYFALPLSVLQT